MYNIPLDSAKLFITILVVLGFSFKVYLFERKKLIKIGLTVRLAIVD